MSIQVGGSTVFDRGSPELAAFTAEFTGVPMAKSLQVGSNAAPLGGIMDMIAVEQTLAAANVIRIDGMPTPPANRVDPAASTRDSTTAFARLNRSGLTH